MNQANAILGLLAETSIHAGAGQKLGAVDLPIQREAHTDWPCIYGTAVKGALRARAQDADLKNIEVVFGPDVQTNNASEYAGSLLVGDARLLLLPVRSLTGTFKWVTCPAVLRRFARDQERLGLGKLNLGPLEVASEQAAVPGPVGADSSLFLEEYRLTMVTADLGAVMTALRRFLPRDERHYLEQRLCLVDDEFFGYLARFATPVTAHVTINYETKTARDTGLRYEESLPPETVFYVPLSASKARKEKATESAGDVLDAIVGELFQRGHSYLQVGGNETVGMGWCRVTPVVPEKQGVVA